MPRSVTQNDIRDISLKDLTPQPRRTLKGRNCLMARPHPSSLAQKMYSVLININGTGRTHWPSAFMRQWTKHRYDSTPDVSRERISNNQSWPDCLPRTLPRKSSVWWCIWSYFLRGATEDVQSVALFWKVSVWKPLSHFINQRPDRNSFPVSW